MTSASATEQDMLWARRLYDIREYKNPSLGIYPIADVPLNVAWHAPINEPDHLTVSSPTPSDSLPLTVWVLGGIINAGFATPKNNHKLSVHIDIMPLMEEDKHEASRLVQCVSPGSVSDMSASIAASRSQRFHIPGSRMPVFHPFDCVWDGRTAITAKNAMARIDARSLKKDDIVLLELEVVKYNRFLKRPFADFTEGKRAWFELQHVVLLKSSPSPLPVMASVRPADDLSITI